MCLQTGQKFVVDNTNPTIKERQKYIDAAKGFNFRITAYYFDTDVYEAIERNSKRDGKEAISIVGIRATKKKLQPPNPDEGYDEIFTIRIVENTFVKAANIENSQT